VKDGSIVNESCARNSLHGVVNVCTCQVKDGSIVNDMSSSVSSLASRVSSHLITVSLLVCMCPLSHCLTGFLC